MVRPLTCRVKNNQSYELGQVAPPSGPVDAELVLWEKAKEWALAEFNKKGPSLDRLLDILVHDTEVVRLTRQRIEELTEARADVSI